MTVRDDSPHVERSRLLRSFLVLAFVAAVLCVPLFLPSCLRRYSQRSSPSVTVTAVSYYVTPTSTVVLSSTQVQTPTPTPTPAWCAARVLTDTVVYDVALTVAWRLLAGDYVRVDARSHVRSGLYHLVDADAWCAAAVLQLEDGCDLPLRPVGLLPLAATDQPEPTAAVVVLLPTSTPVPTCTSSPTPMQTPTLTQTPSPTPTQTPSPTPMQTPSPTPSPFPTPTGGWPCTLYLPAVFR